MGNKKVYVILSKSHTLMAKLVRAYTKKPYSHTSISLTKDVDTLYSFGRLYPRLMFPAGFISEGWDKGFFKLFPKTMAIIMEKEVTDAEYNEILQRLTAFIDNPKKYKYSVKSVFYTGFKKPCDEQYKYVCSSFVAYVLQNVLPIGEHPSLVCPDDFQHFGMKKIYEGAIGDYGKFYKENVADENQL